MIDLRRCRQSIQQFNYLLLDWGFSAWRFHRSSSGKASSRNFPDIELTVSHAHAEARRDVQLGFGKRNVVFNPTAITNCDGPNAALIASKKAARPGGQSAVGVLMDRSMITVQKRRQRARGCVTNPPAGRCGELPGPERTVGRRTNSGVKNQCFILPAACVSGQM